MSQFDGSLAGVKGVSLLDEKYLREEGRILANGNQALIRMILAQRSLDRSAGIDSAGFVTGYRGSPLGGIDQAFAQARRFTEAADILFQPGVNEDLAATAILGAQQINLFEPARKDGVFAMWYGKGPGVDRSGDALRHGNLAGSASKGGVLLLAGDDHTCKSSTTAHQSEYALVDAMIPILHPSSVAEIVQFGLIGWALSRYSGCWSAMKLVADTMDSAASFELQPPFSPKPPSDFETPPGGLNIRWPDTANDQEERLVTQKLPAVRAFARANQLDRLVLGRARNRLAIVTTGKSYLDLLQALGDLGLNEAVCQALGVSIYKVALVWPLEKEGILRLAEGHDELLVVEEKRPLIEGQIKEILYNLPAGRRPKVHGKQDAEGRPLLQAHGGLSARQIARALAFRISDWIDEPGLRARVDRFREAPRDEPAEQLLKRTPYFCSGCPHNTSTRVPEGSRALAGIGCHWMAQLMDRSTATATHMGGEGANWIGQAPFSAVPHVFQNMGDGTYFHSGLLAIRAAVAANVNITYKILFNDAVAMTGGQKHDGPLSPDRIARQVRAEGVQTVVVVADDPGKYGEGFDFPPDVSIRHRDDLDEVQRALRDTPGVTVLIYDQVCAAEKRRRRKRSVMVDPPKRVFINELVCEGCGDCSTKSNCLSVAPVDTEFGTKRRIDQSSCNKDYSCLKGFCPSFVVVEGGGLRKRRGTGVEALLQRELPEPGPRSNLKEPYNILIAGVGGTGVVTIGAVLAMAAHIEGRECSTLDMTGMAQKGGPVTTHLRLAAAPAQMGSVRIGDGAADLVLGCDLVVAAGEEAMSVIGRGRTQVVVDAQETITGAFIRDSSARVPIEALVDQLRRVAGDDAVARVAAAKLASAAFGDSIATNFFMVGYAYQLGLIPIDARSILAAIEVNGAGVAMNSQAFALGRLTAADPSIADEVKAAAGGDEIAQRPRAAHGLDELIARRAEFLTAYQGAAYAASYSGFVEDVRQAERAADLTGEAFATAVARGLFKLMAYKDEYEVARLHTSAEFRRQIAETFEGETRVSFQLAPPLLARVDPATGHPRKMTFGPWFRTVFAILARFKFLRGGPFDLFGYTAERRQERELIGAYKSMIGRILPELSVDTLARALEFAAWPERIRGYGHVKSGLMAEAIELWKSVPASNVLSRQDPASSGAGGDKPVARPDERLSTLSRNST